MMEQDWIDARAEMDMALHYEDEEQLDLSNLDVQETTGIVNGFEVSGLEPNKAEIKLWVTVSISETEQKQFKYTDTVSQSDSNTFLKSLFESPTQDKVVSPLSDQVSVSKENGEWMLNGKPLLESTGRDTPHSRKDLHTYYETIVKKSKDSVTLKTGTFSDFYVLQSPPNFQQDFIVGLFVQLPTGELRVIEVPHDSENKSKIIEILFDTDKTFSDQLNKDIPVWYEPKKDKWSISKRSKPSGLISTLFSKIGIFNLKISENNSIDFGRKFQFGNDSYRYPLPTTPNSVPLDKKASVGL